MSIQKLPTELFLQITDYLTSPPDLDSLRISCRKFRTYLPPPNNYRSSPDFFKPGITKDHAATFKKALRWRRDFLSRLLREGNLFHEHYTANIAICGRCCLVRPTSKFPMDILREDYRTCEDCIATIMGQDMEYGSLMVYNGKEYGSCKDCGEFLSGDELHCHSSDPTPGDSRNAVIGEYLCTDCHMEACFDLGCEGWLKGYILEHPENFCLGNDFVCGECRNCDKIERMRRRQERQEN